MTYERIEATLSEDGSRLDIVLKIPPMNMLNMLSMKELLACAHEYCKDDRLRVIVLSGDGKCFSAGASLVEHKKATFTNMLEEFHRLLMGWLTLPVVTIANIHGFCLGGGFELAMMCDFIIAHPKTLIGLPEITAGVFAPPGAAMLNMLIGKQRALRIGLTGDLIKVTDAEDWGLLHVVTKTPDEEISRLVKTFKRLSPVVLARNCDVWRRPFMLQLGNANNYLLGQYMNLMKTEDASIGIEGKIADPRAVPEWVGR